MSLCGGGGVGGRADRGFTDEEVSGAGDAVQCLSGAFRKCEDVPR